MTRRKSDAQTIGSEEWKHIISSGAQAMGIDVTPSQMEQVVGFANLLTEWNRRINLTAITDPREMAVKHFIDSMAALPQIPETGSLLDIGSGGGFPGLVIAIFRPTLHITSIDSVRKKISFQQQLIRTLGLTSARALHTRAEALPEKEIRYDTVVSRALGVLDMFTSLGLPLLSDGGKIVAYKGIMDKGEGDDIEIFKKKHAELSIHTHSYSLPSAGDNRTLVFIRRR